MAFPGAERLAALKEHQQDLPPLWQYALQAWVRESRSNIAMRKRRLNDAVKRLDEYDQLLATFEQDDDDGGSDEPFSPYSVESRGHERSQADLRNALHGIFEDMLAKDVEKEWVKTDEGLRVPVAKAVNQALTELGFEPLTNAQVKEAYISYLNGDH